MLKKTIFSILFASFLLGNFLLVDVLSESGRINHNMLYAMAQDPTEDDEPNNNQAEGTKSRTVETCVEFNFAFMKCTKTVTTTVTIPCCTTGNTTCSAGEPC